jgi:hypothetical protein
MSPYHNDTLQPMKKQKPAPRRMLKSMAVEPVPAGYRNVLTNRRILPVVPLSRSVYAHNGAL